MPVDADTFKQGDERYSIENGIIHFLNENSEYASNVRESTGEVMETDWSEANIESDAFEEYIGCFLDLATVSSIFDALVDNGKRNDVFSIPGRRAKLLSSTGVTASNHLLPRLGGERIRQIAVVGSLVIDELNANVHLAVRRRCDTAVKFIRDYRGIATVGHPTRSDRDRFRRSEGTDAAVLDSDRDGVDVFVLGFVERVMNLLVDGPLVRDLLVRCNGDEPNGRDQQDRGSDDQNPLN